MVILKSFCSISTSLTPLLATNLISSWIWDRFIGWLIGSTAFRPVRAAPLGLANVKVPVIGAAYPP